MTFPTTQIIVTLVVAPESDRCQRGNRKVTLSVGKQGSVPIFQEGVLNQLYESDFIGDAIDAIAERIATEPVTPETTAPPPAIDGKVVVPEQTFSQTTLL